MKRKLLLITILLVGGLFVSCSNDDSGNTENPVLPEIKEPLPITITELTSDFVINGENLELKGTNFVNKDYPTKVFINQTEVVPNEITNTKILLISPNVKTGTNTIRIQIDKVNSVPLNFFVLAKGWNKLTVLGDATIANSTVFDNSQTIFSLVNWSNPVKLAPKSSGFIQTTLNPATNEMASFQMYDEKTGVFVTATEAFFSNDSFNTSNKINIDNNFNPVSTRLMIGSLNNDGCLLYSSFGAHIFTKDNGATIIKNEAPDFAKINKTNVFTTRLAVHAFGKSSSNGKFYQLGKIYDFVKYGSTLKNIVMESETGYSNWVVKDSISNADGNKSGYKFVNINKILSVDYYNKTLLMSTDVTKTWTSIKTDVSNIFLRTETQWYIQSGDKIFVTKDSGLTWELELELPAGSVINNISFSKTKIIVSGNKGLHYLKLE
ncbi:hypothetical protein L1276_001717 [Flavobacterium sp. HSC-32F16]|uniref:IPT/TIG domain-containing protein n=1 Tax=Flavobacterium sp. HSC-32F16 TaxID=2910964 RepID=UPI0020A297EE|nr:IPT/TIG domain-containing protein [Flavobacterium sp. HSC-32F16]MCP2026573.1 hypothetical protein [Flavobacterium sp. HSC-32F16]